MDNIANKIRHASLEENSVDILVDLVYLLSAQGLTRQNIYNLFAKYLMDNQEFDEWVIVRNKFNGDHPVELVLDRLSGWCRQDMILLPDEPFEKR